MFLVEVSPAIILAVRPDAVKQIAVSLLSVVQVGVVERVPGDRGNVLGAQVRYSPWVLAVLAPISGQGKCYVRQIARSPYPLLAECKPLIDFSGEPRPQSECSRGTEL